MRSLLWTGVFVVLMVELVVTLVLVIPVPHKIRNWICLKVSVLDLKKKLATPISLLFTALTLALLDTTTFLSQIYSQEREGTEDPLGIHSNNNNSNPVDKHLMKEKEYKAARNMYLVGFALTLLFVIGRITELMHEHAQLQGRLENLRLAASMMETDETQEQQQQTPIEESGTAPENDSPAEGIEMKPMGLKKRD